MSTAIFPRGFF